MAELTFCFPSTFHPLSLSDSHLEKKLVQLAGYKPAEVSEKERVRANEAQSGCDSADWRVRYWVFWLGSVSRGSNVAENDLLRRTALTSSTNFLPSNCWSRPSPSPPHVFACCTRCKTDCHSWWNRFPAKKTHGRNLEAFDTKLSYWDVCTNATQRPFHFCLLRFQVFTFYTFCEFQKVASKVTKIFRVNGFFRFFGRQ